MTRAQDKIDAEGKLVDEKTRENLRKLLAALGARVAERHPA